MSTNNDELRAWAAREWIKRAGNNTPLSRSIRAGKARDQALKRRHKAMLRSQAAQSGARTRALKIKQAADALALKEKLALADAEFDRRRWAALLLGQGGPGVSSEDQKKKA